MITITNEKFNKKNLKFNLMYISVIDSDKTFIKHFQSKTIGSNFFVYKNIDQSEALLQTSMRFFPISEVILVEIPDPV